MYLFFSCPQPHCLVESSEYEQYLCIEKQMWQGNLNQAEANIIRKCNLVFLQINKARRRQN